jgi:DNA-binding response OmpR family regulator
MLNRRSRVLIVEDDVKTSETIALYLRHAGYDVAQSLDGEAALEKTASWEPDLVVLENDRDGSPARTRVGSGRLRQ